MSDFDRSGEMVAATLRGYRSWQLKKYKGKPALGSMGVATHWETKRLEAKCVTSGAGSMPPYVWGGMVRGEMPPKNHSSPEIACRCGIYGWYEPEWALKEHAGPILGVVEYSGKILLGTKGFRAEKAEIVALAPGVESRVFGDIRKTVTFIDLLSAYIEESGKGITSIDYGGIQKHLEKELQDEMVDYLTRIINVAKSFDVPTVCATTAEVREKFPPNLDTVTNLIGRKLELYENSHYVKRGSIGWEI